MGEIFNILWPSQNMRTLMNDDNECILLKHGNVCQKMHICFFVHEICTAIIFLITTFFFRSYVFLRRPQFCEISTYNLSYVLPVKYLVEILQNFVVFSEYMNFTKKNKMSTVQHKFEYAKLWLFS